nr:immunoglobulin light chain junction region [Macaca mulatta]
CQHGYGSPYTF